MTKRLKFNLMDFLYPLGIVNQQNKKDEKNNNNAF